MDPSYEDYEELLSDADKLYEAIPKIRDQLRNTDLMKPFNLLVFSHSFATFRHPSEFREFLKEAHTMAPEEPNSADD